MIDRSGMPGERHIQIIFKHLLATVRLMKEGIL